MKRIIPILFLFSTLSAYAGGDPIAGKSKSLVCSACHGETGISINPQWPHLAGQHAPYLIKQLHDFKQGISRDNTIMGPLLTNLTEQDLADISAYFATQTPVHSTSSSQSTRGETLYKQGDLNKHITACIACHGPAAEGNAEAGFPRLCGQHANYTIQQLQLFKSGKRHNDLSSIMQTICSHMDDDDMKAVAAYLNQLH